MYWFSLPSPVSPIATKRTTWAAPPVVVSAGPVSLLVSTGPVVVVLVVLVLAVVVGELVGEAVVVPVPLPPPEPLVPALGSAVVLPAVVAVAPPLLPVPADPALVLPLPSPPPQATSKVRARNIDEWKDRRGIDRDCTPTNGEPWMCANSRMSPG